MKCGGWRIRIAIKDRGSTSFGMIQVESSLVALANRRALRSAAIPLPFSLQLDKVGPLFDKLESFAKNICYPHILHKKAQIAVPSVGWEAILALPAFPR